MLAKKFNGHVSAAWEAIKTDDPSDMLGMLTALLSELVWRTSANKKAGTPMVEDFLNRLSDALDYKFEHQDRKTGQYRE